jgi:hypothetical protein
MTDSLAPLSERTTQAGLFRDDEAIRKREEESERVWRDIQMLGVDLPNPIVEKIAASYNGMTPMERFLVETCKLQEKDPDIEGRTTVSSCGATIGSLEETPCSGIRPDQTGKTSERSL